MTDRKNDRGIHYGARGGNSIGGIAFQVRSPAVNSYDGTDVFLLDYRNADTFSRASEASFVDPRPPANGGTAVSASAFVESTEAENWKGSADARIFSDGAVRIEGSRVNLVDYSSDASAWTLSGDGMYLANQAAPDGGTSAYLILDTDAVSQTYFLIAAMTVATVTHKASAYYLKDQDVSRFPEFQIFEWDAVITGNSISIHLNTQTGATVTRLGTPTSVTVTSRGDWWFLEVEFVVSTGGDIGVLLRPAAGTVIGTNADAAQGSTTVWGVTVEAVSLAGRPVSSPIRTTGAAGTRNTDIMTFLQANVPDALFSLGFSFDFWITVDIPSSPWTPTLLNAGAVVSRNYITLTLDSGRINYRSTNLSSYYVTATASAGDKITVTVQHGAQMEVFVNDVSAGTVSLVGQPAWAAGDLHIGDSAANNVSSYAVLSRPRYAP